MKNFNLISKIVITYKILSRKISILFNHENNIFFVFIFVENSILKLYFKLPPNSVYRNSSNSSECIFFL